MGYASLVDFGVVQTLSFGLAGHELTLKLMQKYGASLELMEAYADVTEKITPAIAASAISVTSKAFLNSNDWEGQGKVCGTGVMLAGLKMHLSFVKKMGLTTDIFMATYVKLLEKVPNMEHGCSQITDVYEQEGTM